MGQTKITLLLLRNALNIKCKRTLGFRSFPYKLFFIITHRCNSRCLTCGSWRLDESSYRSELTLHEFKKVVDSVREKAFWIAFTGGEPTVIGSFKEYIIYIAESCKKLKIVQINTNGLLPQRIKDILDTVKYYRNIEFFFIVSLDGIGQEYTKIRGVDGYARVMESCSLLKRYSDKYSNIKSSLQLTISEYNLDTCLDTFDLIINKDSFIPVVTFSQKAEMFKNDGLNITLLEQNGIVGLIDRMIERYRFKRFLDLSTFLFLRLGKRFLITGKSPISCNAGYATVTIHPTGDITPCPHLLFNSKQNIREWDYDLTKVLADTVYLKNRRSIENCRKCWQNCEAGPSIIQSPFKSLYLSLKG